MWLSKREGGVLLGGFALINQQNSVIVMRVLKVLLSEPRAFCGPDDALPDVLRVVCGVVNWRVWAGSRESKW